MADYAIHDTTLYGISDVIRKKDGTTRKQILVGAK